MELKDGATYVDGWANPHTIQGACRDFPEWCWSLQGEWYERATGRHVGYHPHHGYSVDAQRSWRDLWKEAGK